MVEKWKSGNQARKSWKPVKTLVLTYIMETTEQQATEIQGEPDAERPSTSGSGSEDESPSSYKDTHATQEEAPVDETPAEAAIPEAAPMDQDNPVEGNRSQEGGSQDLVRSASDREDRPGRSPPRGDATHQTSWRYGIGDQQRNSGKGRGEYTHPGRDNHFRTPSMGNHPHHQHHPTMGLSMSEHGAPSASSTPQFLPSPAARDSREGWEEVQKETV